MVNPHNVGLVIGALIGGWHLLWLLLILIGWAHMIQPIYMITPFDPLAAVTLIGITAVIGYIFGFLGALIWNRLHR